MHFVIDSARVGPLSEVLQNDKQHGSILVRDGLGGIFLSAEVRTKVMTRTHVQMKY